MKLSPCVSEYINNNNNNNNNNKYTLACTYKYVTQSTITLLALQPTTNDTYNNNNNKKYNNKNSFNIRSVAARVNKTNLV